MRISEVMTKNVATVTPSISADDAWREMRDRRIHHLVVMKGGAVLGVVSERDLGGRAGAAVRRGATVESLMSRGAVTAAPDDTVRQAANQMRGRSLGCLPVVSGKRLVGILTVSDVLELVGRGVQRPIERGTRRSLSRRGPGRDAHHSPAT
ncbi:MAG: CBS domain-containing protein [Planctomycetes bacterium]|nr:CBS domain-containing protein [Planctomycetota bacterium]